MPAYNWQAEARGDTFRSWLLPTVLSRNEQFDAISDATANFTDIDFGITVNGIPVDADAFLDGVERNMRHFANERAAEMIKMIKESLHLNALHELMMTIEAAADDAVRLAVRGTELEPYLDQDN